MNVELKSDFEFLLENLVKNKEIETVHGALVYSSKKLLDEFVENSNRSATKVSYNEFETIYDVSKNFRNYINIIRKFVVDANPEINKVIELITDVDNNEDEEVIVKTVYESIIEKVVNHVLNTKDSKQLPKYFTK